MRVQLDNTYIFLGECFVKGVALNQIKNLILINKL